MSPLYLQVADALRDEIIRGLHPIGSQLPTEEDLAARFDVSRATVREALRKLREERLVVSRRGSGTTVARRAAAHEDVRELASISDLLQFARSTRFHIETMGIVSCDRELSHKLRCEEGHNWLAVCGYRYELEDNLAVCWSEIYIDAAYASVGRLLERHRGNIFELIEDMHGVSVAEVNQELAVVPVPENLSDGLGIEPDASVVLVSRTFRLTSGEVSQVVFNFHPADRFRLSMTIRRVKS